MKNAPAPEKRRTYRQGARAESAEATARRIMDAFIKRSATQWFDEITLDSLAQDAGVTVQTIIRRFGGKEGIVQAAAEGFGHDVLARRRHPPGDIKKALDGLLNDYEASGPYVMRILFQEDRYPLLKDVADIGRRGHRQWLGEVFAPWLDPLSPKAREARLDALVAATDLYLWRLVRVDMGRDLNAYRKVVFQLLAGALDGEKPWEKTK